MRFRELGLPGVWVLEAELHADDRGVFRRHFCVDEYRAHGLLPDVVQGNISENRMRHTLRGFHYQRPPHGEAKTLSCLTGAIYDIAVDLRPDSSHYMKWIAVELSAARRESLYVPAGFANAWLTLADNTMVHYYMSATYAPEHSTGIRFDDPAFGFSWPAPPSRISARDRGFPDFRPETRE